MTVRGLRNWKAQIDQAQGKEHVKIIHFDTHVLFCRGAGVNYDGNNI